MLIQRILFIKYNLGCFEKLDLYYFHT